MHPIVIAGGGVVGLTTALLLAKGAVPVIVLEPRASVSSWTLTETDLRVVALTRASQQLFEQAGVWSSISAKRVSPYVAMHVWDGSGSGEISFKAEDVAQEDMGHIIELSLIEQELLAKLATYKDAQCRFGLSVSNFHAADNHVVVELSDGSSLRASLLIACDGARSALREKAGISCTENTYGHHALVAQIHTEHPHQKTAYQRFTPSGPLALLPLSDPHQCSIVWSAPEAEILQNLALTEAEFSNALTNAFERKLGALTLQSKRLSFPLVERHAQRYLADRLVLLGDAAHTMHPLAGQGLNQSLGDVAEFIERAATLKKQSADIGDSSLYRAFERSRRAEAAQMLFVVKAFKELFTHHDLPLVLARNMGMSVLNQHPIAKAEVIRKAMGLS